MDEPPASLPPEALAYYARGREAARLGEGHGVLELARTCDIHHPDELRGEVLEAGFALDALLGVEGPAWPLPDLAARWADPERRREILAAARAVEREPSLLGFHAHILAVGRVPPGAR